MTIPESGFSGSSVSNENHTKNPSWNKDWLTYKKIKNKIRVFIYIIYKQHIHFVIIIWDISWKIVISK